MREIKFRAWNKLKKIDEYGEVKWDIESARFIAAYDYIITDFDNWNGKDLEVVGTIYDE